ncbi:MAG TPA: alginate lyase family protein, partial [Candidatus Udaeobacter sp.]|nr:alginate lyase family protein [Candidatus Udaeobacter sp.]
ALGRIALASEAAARSGEELPDAPRDRIRILSRDWHRDPESGLSLPRIHWSRLDYREPRIEGAVRRLWYAARHLDCPELALGYYLTGDERAAAAALAPVMSWIGQCPPGLGIHWSVPLELGLRLMSWSMTARLLQGSEALAAAAPAIARSVHAQAEHMLTYRARFSSANNHLVAQAAGLLHAGFAFSGLRAAARWRRVGGEILWAELLRQSTPDGVSREASLHYQEFVLELGLLSWLVLRANGTEPPPNARARLAAMLDFVAVLDAFPGGPPDFGDSDGQTALPFLGRTGPRSSLLALGAVLCARPEWKAQVRSLSRPAAILLGSEGRKAFAALEDVRPARGSRWFESGGMAVLSDAMGERGLVFDCAPLGYLATAAHGHADCLAVSLGSFGQPLLIDPGTFTYHAEPRFRDHFRSTAAHNTIRIDGEEQSEMLGAFLWGSKARPQVEAASTLPAWDLIIARHHGYQRLRSPVVHRRWVVFVKPDYFWVVDEIEGAGRHLIESFWHLPPGARVARQTQGLEVTGPESADLTLLWAG